MSVKDGGPAFPTKVWVGATYEGDDVLIFDGMSLRDYFAGQAIGLLLEARDLERSTWPREVAEEAYRLADAMLAARD